MTIVQRIAIFLPQNVVPDMKALGYKLGRAHRDVAWQMTVQRERYSVGRDMLCGVVGREILLCVNARVGAAAAPDRQPLAIYRFERVLQL